MPAARVTIDAIGDDSGKSLKKRRIPGACDICKRKKIRCDSGEKPGNRCSNCLQYGYECTHREVTKTLGPAKGYVESLEARLEKMDKLLARLLPGIDVNKEVDGIEESEDTPEPLSFPRNDDDDGEVDELSHKINKLVLNPPQNRFFGKSSGLQLVQTALDIREQLTGEKITLGPDGGCPDHCSHPDCTSDKKPVSMFSKRSQYWNVPGWIVPHPEAEEEPPKYTFPEDDLLYSLVDIYFVHANPFLPLLHRPTFEKHLADKLHLSDHMFGAVLLNVCAIASRYSDDPRVFLEGAGTARSAGWKWFGQVDPLRKSLFKQTSLFELQMQALSVIFAQSSETPHGAWTQLGMALRLAQEVGAHRRRLVPPNAEDELWKRAFWVLFSLDRIVSSYSGRPCGLQDEDYDLDLPIECDDEYWETGFVQPEGKPSSMAFFNCYLGLMDILAYAMRAIYSIKKPKNLLGRAVVHSDQQIIADLDSALNSWMDKVPSHLRWKPNSKDELFLKQSATIYATYYHIQIFIHRPFIPSPRNPRPIIFPSLAICTNAARSCCHVLEVYNRLSPMPVPHLHTTAFTAALILLLNMWTGKRSGLSARGTEDIRVCMEMLRKWEERWASAGKFGDIIAELAFAGDLSIGDSISSPLSSSSSRKRQRGEEDESASSSSSSADSPASLEEPRSVAGSRRVSTSISKQSLSPTLPQDPPMNIFLPTYSNELGSLPVYGQFNFSDTMVNPFPQDHRARFNGMGFPGYPGPPSLQFDPSQHLNAGSNNLNSGRVPDNLFTVADAMVKDALFNNQTTGNRTIINQPDPQLDLSSLFSGDSLDFGDLTQMGSMDNDLMNMWCGAPTSFGADEWGSYLASVEQLTNNGQGSNAVSPGHYNRPGEGNLPQSLV